MSEPSTNKPPTPPQENDLTPEEHKNEAPILLNNNPTEKSENNATPEEYKIEERDNKTESLKGASLSPVVSTIENKDTNNANQSSKEESVFDRLPRYQILVEGLPPSMSEEEIKHLFRFLNDYEGTTFFGEGDGLWSTALVSFLDREGARRALKIKFNDTEVKMRWLPQRAMFVENISRTTSEERLREMFEPCGEVKEVVRILDFSGRPHSFAFVCMKTQDGLDNALKLDLNQDGNKLFIRLAIHSEFLDDKLPSASIRPADIYVSTNVEPVFGGSGLFGGGLFGGSTSNSPPRPQVQPGSSLFGGSQFGGGLFGAGVREVTVDNPHQFKKGGIFGNPEKAFEGATDTDTVNNTEQSGGGLFGTRLFGADPKGSNTSPEKTTTGGLFGAFGGGFGGTGSSAATIGSFFGKAEGTGSIFGARSGGLFGDSAAPKDVSPLGNKEVVVTSASGLKLRAQSLFEGLFKSKKFADVTCDVRGEEILAHKVVLSESSQYFDDILSEDTSDSNMIRITIKDSKPDTFKALLEFLYCGSIKANEDLAIELLRLSKQYEINDLKEKCEYILSSLLSLENFIKISKVADEFQSSGLRDAVLSFTVVNGGKMIQNEEMAGLPKSIVIDMIEKLCVTSSSSYSFFPSKLFS